ncbi:NAD(P)H-hydrate dehydratase [Paracoccus sp. S3-43]|uniref:NAD(P)H-hydrate dehydratase n=1 Tax=Paracoccus sp. S3-43 TaxID=3030011 RepID=UPI0023B14299|nr:NAD(P)H-hydrate dehydratase [Paracoccus sp. S3-43]WEF25250.1 NAD(P)H-hydrate dehydratase [Paracoccus sp. S3-43]
MLTGTEVLTTAQMRAIESAAMTSGEVTGLELMQRAGRAVAGQIRLRWPRPGRVTVLCGPGNNGGDGYVVARLLHRAGWRVRVLGMDNMPGPDAAETRRRWREVGPIAPLTEAVLRGDADSDLYVDAIFGTGLTRPPEGEIAALLAQLFRPGGESGHQPCLIAIDCPSGLCLDSGRPLPLPHGRFDSGARLTVAFDSPKPGHLIGLGPLLCGDLVIADIGLRSWRERNPTDRGLRPAALQTLWPPFDIPDDRRQPPGMSALAKHSVAQSHKYSHGHALILAGGPAKGGAARLSARAALRIGAGLVTVGATRDALPDHAGSPDALMRRAVDDGKDLREVLGDKRVNALCIGPGCGIDRAAALLAEALGARRPAVLDADALTALSRAPDLMAALHHTCVLTPHGGEFARLFPDIAERLDAPPLQGPAYSKLDAARDAAARCGAVVLLKGPDTVIAAPDGPAVIHSAFDVPWLATAGAGDVLSGIITGLLARGLPPLDAASLGALIHAKAARAFGPGLIADDLPDMIPAVLRALQKSQSSSSVATALPMT